jgi:hypothetical protein
MAVKIPVSMFPVGESAATPVAFVIGVTLLLYWLGKNRAAARTLTQPK